MLEEALSELYTGWHFPDQRELNPLQLAYIGDTLHDLYVRCRLMEHPASVGNLHKQATQRVSAHAQAVMLELIGELLTDEEQKTVKSGRNAHAKHAPPKHAEAADYTQATALEALWGLLFVSKQFGRLDYLIGEALTRYESYINNEEN